MKKNKHPGRGQGHPSSRPNSDRKPGQRPERTRGFGAEAKRAPKSQQDRGTRPERDRNARLQQERSARPDQRGPRPDRDRNAKPHQERPSRTEHRAPRPERDRHAKPHQERSPRPEQQAPRPERERPPRPERVPAPPRPAPSHPERERESHGSAARRLGEIWIYGHHPAAAALANPDRKILRIIATPEATAKLSADTAIQPRTLGLIKEASRKEIDALVGEDAVHQGVAVHVHTLDHELAEVLERIVDVPNACIVVLDQVTDPHNVGAILRSAAAFGAAAVLAPDRHAPDESGTMAKSASGALDKIPYIKAGNLVRALELLKEHKFWLVGLEAEAPQQLADIKLDGRIALVVGAEGEGLRRLVRETCDHVAALPMAGNIESLNVSNAAAVALYERARQVKPRA